MIESTICPICGKEGLPDFHQEDVVCPCCESDLSVYRKIRALSTENNSAQAKVNNSNRIWFFALGATILVLASLCSWLLLFNKVSSNEAPTVVDLQKENQLLNDSIATLNSQFLTIQRTEIQSIDSTRFYIVRKGDSFCKISKQLFGTEARFNEIAELNRLNQKTLLHRGDTLKVPTR